MAQETAPNAEVTRLLRQVGGGDRGALDALVPLVIDELRQRASAQLRHERPGHTLQTTALAHEAYLRLVDQREAGWSDRNHFFAVAATCIRRVLVDHARKASRLKRGGDRARITLEQVEVAEDALPAVDLLALDDALGRLAVQDERKAKVVELRWFAGLDIAATADALGVSHATVERDWAMARAWLHRELADS